jgi:hypothetical protein
MLIHAQMYKRETEMGSFPVQIRDDHEPQRNEGFKKIQPQSESNKKRIKDEDFDLDGNKKKKKERSLT